MGPIIGSQCWRLTHGRAMKLIEAKDREFHKHIVKNRVDPTAQSATNPVPDFYGTSCRSCPGFVLLKQCPCRREDRVVAGLQTGMLT